MNKTVIASIAVVAVYLIGAGSDAMAAPPPKGGVAGLVRVSAPSFIEDPTTINGNLSTQPTQTAWVECGAGKKVVGGGYTFILGGPVIPITDNVPDINRNGWIVTANNLNAEANPWRVTAVAMCADAQ